MRDEQEVRRKLNKALGRPIPNDIWSTLEDEDWVKDVLWFDEGKVFDDFVRYAKDLLANQFENTDVVRKQRRQKGNGALRVAISTYLAADARKVPGVVQFRTHRLGGRLLTRDQASEWLRDRFAEGPFHDEVILRLPVGVHLEFERKWIVTPSFPPADQLEIIGRPARDTLDFISGPNGATDSMQVPTHGPLRELYELCRSLTRKFGWAQAQATTFVLTDAVPIVSGIQSVVALRLPYRSQTRISFTVDPRLTPSELARAYAKYRAKLAPRVARCPSEKSAALAMFALDHPDLRRDHMDKWNTSCPSSWAYAQLRRFRENAKRARKNVERLTRETVLDFRRMAEPNSTTPERDE